LFARELKTAELGRVTVFWKRGVCRPHDKTIAQQASRDQPENSSIGGSPKGRQNDDENSYGHSESSCAIKSS
jgi:hypothetical protein